VKRPLVNFPEGQKIPDRHWLAGFASGEGCFFVRIIKSSSFSIGFQVQLVFQISQHNRDEELMRSLISYFGCGFIVKNYRASWVEFIVCKFS
jgi:hypothetical protein